MATFASKTEGSAPPAPKAVSPCPHCAKQTIARRGRTEDITPPEGHPGHHYTIPSTWRWTTSLVPLFGDGRDGVFRVVGLDNNAWKYELGDAGQERLRPFLDAVAEKVSVCKLCSAPMWWIWATWAGKTPTVFPHLAANAKLHPFSANGVSHFADCPRAAEARKRGGA